MRELAHQLRRPVRPAAPHELVRAVRHEPACRLARVQPVRPRAQIPEQGIDRLENVARPDRLERLRRLLALRYHAEPSVASDGRPNIGSGSDPAYGELPNA